MIGYDNVSIDPARYYPDDGPSPGSDAVVRSPNHSIARVGTCKPLIEALCQLCPLCHRCCSFNIPSPESPNLKLVKLEKIKTCETGWDITFCAEILF